MEYLLNSCVIYDNIEKTLSLTDSSESTIKLSNPANRLLLELVKKVNLIIPREVLIKTVWEDFGFIGSHSNLNSYISELRKAFFSLGLAEKIIITIPKQGIILTATIGVKNYTYPNEPLTTPQENDVSHISTNIPESELVFMTENNFITDPASSSLDIFATREFTASDLSKSKNIVKTHLFSKKIHSVKNIFFFLNNYKIILIAIFIVIMIFFFFFNSPPPISIKKVDIQLIHKYHNCKIFIINDYDIYPLSKTISLALSDIRNEHLDCLTDKYDIFYAKNIDDNKVIISSFFGLCRIETKTKTFCTTIVNLNEKH